jgi:hypothetical protein
MTQNVVDCYTSIGPPVDAAYPANRAVLVLLPLVHLPGAASVYVSATVMRRRVT